WDSYGPRSERIDVLDAGTGTVLNSQTVSSFTGGQYLVWNVSGHVQFCITNLVGGSNAVVSGLFFGPGAVSASGVQDAGFESPNVGTGSWGDFQYNPTGTRWNFTGSAGVAGNGSGFTSGNPNAPEGTQVGFLQGTGALTQSVNMAAGSYQLT